MSVGAAVNVWCVTVSASETTTFSVASALNSPLTLRGGVKMSVLDVSMPHYSGRGAVEDYHTIVHGEDQTDSHPITMFWGGKRGYGVAKGWVSPRRAEQICSRYGWKNWRHTYCGYGVKPYPHHNEGDKDE